MLFIFAVNFGRSVEAPTTTGLTDLKIYAINVLFEFFLLKFFR